MIPEGPPVIHVSDDLFADNKIMRLVIHRLLCYQNDEEL